MSGVQNLANAVTTDPSFAKQTNGMMPVKEARKLVHPGTSGPIKTKSPILKGK